MSEHLDDVQLSRLIDNDLSLTLRQAAVRHLSTCQSCATRHEELVEVVATLRTHPAVDWSRDPAALLAERLSRPTLRRLPRNRSIGIAVAAAALSLAALFPLFVAAATLLRLAWRVSTTPLSVIGPSAVPLAGARLVVVLAVVAVCGPLAAYPLARWR